MIPVRPIKNESKPHILFTCGREPSYPRNALILSMLNDRYPVISITSSHSRLLVRHLIVSTKLIKRWKKRINLSFVGFLGQPIVPILRLFWKGPILFDAFISLYDTFCYDRQWFSPRSIMGKFTFWLDKYSCSLADLIILDTQAQANYFHEHFGVPEKKLRVLFVGCDDDLFSPGASFIDAPVPVVLFYGSFLPLHGVETIINAASYLRDTQVLFRIIGSGDKKSSAVSLASKLALTNVEFRSSVPLERLPVEISGATICLGGHFGTSEKAKRVIAGKTFQCLAMAKPTIVGDNDANRELLTHGKDAWFCKMGDPVALADAIRLLLADKGLRNRLGENARQTFLQRASRKVLSEQLYHMIDTVSGVAS
mgnify:CR=1 FL=1